MTLTIPIYQLDAFADGLFTGNPAAVCPLERWLPDETMQRIAFENNLSETAFFVREEAGWRIRWFTPTVEVKLCGHATLASAYVYFRELEPSASEVVFHSLSGALPVRRDGDLLTLDFPAAGSRRIEVPRRLVEALGVEPHEVMQGSTDWLCLLPSEESVRALSPRLDMLRELDARAVIVTAAGEQVDFVSRFFAPRCGIDEDPATGSAHTLLTPFWAARLGRTTLEARQLSRRGGWLRCELRGDRVALSGRVFPYLRGTLELG